MCYIIWQLFDDRAAAKNKFLGCGIIHKESFLEDSGYEHFLANNNYHFADPYTRCHIYSLLRDCVTPYSCRLKVSVELFIIIYDPISQSLCSGIFIQEIKHLLQCYETFTISWRKLKLNFILLCYCVTFIYSRILSMYFYLYNEIVHGSL